MDDVKPNISEETRLNNQTQLEAPKITSLHIHTLYSRFFDFLKLLSYDVSDSSTSSQNTEAASFSPSTLPSAQSSPQKPNENSPHEIPYEIVYDPMTSCENLLVNLIDKGIPEIISGDGENEQNLFAQASCFTHLLTFLNNSSSQEKPIEQQKRLCFGVIRALTYLLRGNNQSKEEFKKMNGYAHLKVLILKIFQNVPTLDVLNSLLNMLVDGTFDLQNRKIIQNVDVVLLIFNLSPYFTFETRSVLFNTFISILSDCPVNGSVCSSVGLISLLIDSIPITANIEDENMSRILLDDIKKMIQIVATHSIR